MEIADVLLSYKNRKIEYPNKITKDQAEIAVELYHRYIDTVLFGSREQGILATNEFIIRLMKTLYSVFHRPGGLKQRIQIYVGDDAWFMAIMRILGMNYSPSPPSTALFIELHSLSGESKIRFWYKGTYVEVPDCGIECDYKSFDALINKRNFKSEKIHREHCQTLEEISENNWPKYILMFLAFGFVFVLFKYNTQFALWAAKKFSKTNKVE